MRIGIIGYGKMGKMIESICIDRGHTIALIVDNAPESKQLIEAKIDVAIEFTMPEVAYKNLKNLAESNIRTVSGTTGWLDKYEEISNLFSKNGVSFIHSTNYSLGVNLFFSVNKKLASLMNGFMSEYNVSMKEIHHTQKLDAPSGTAITLAEGLIEALEDKKNWVLGKEEATSNEINITAVREDPAPGTHIVTYKSKIDEIEITHTANSREGFALGAVIAAEFINGKNGVFTMKDVLGI